MKVFEQDSFTTRLEEQAYHDLYDQSRLSGAVYLTLFLAIVFATPLFREHTLAASILTLGAVTLSGIRLASRTRALKEFRLNPAFWKKVFYFSALMSSLLWGLCSLAIIYHYKIDSMPAIYVMVITCGVISGGVVSMAPQLLLMRLYITFTLLPIPIWGLISGEWHISVLFLFYIPAISAIGKKIHLSYWESTQNTMLLADKTRQLQATIDELTQNAATLKESSGSLTTISGEMHGFSSDMTLQAEHVAAAAELLVENATSISAAIDQTSGNVQDTVTSVEEMGHTIKEISSQSARALSITTGAVSQADSASAKISELDSAARKIGNISEVITEISEQTNLLALNATIEAARAGEAGKGFAVVANEIKELARQTAEATSGINDQVGDIQSATTETAKEITLISEIISDVNEIVTTVASAIEEQSSATGEIESNVGEMANGIGEISKNMLESKASSEEIAGTIRSVKTEAQKNLESSGTVKTSAEELLEMAGRLGEIINRLNSDT